MRRSDIGCSSEVRCKINTDGLWVTGEVRDISGIDEPKRRWKLYADDGSVYEVDDTIHEMFSYEEWVATRWCGVCRTVDVETWEIESFFLARDGVTRACGKCLLNHAGILEGMLFEDEGKP